MRWSYTWRWMSSSASEGPWSTSPRVSLGWSCSTPRIWACSRSRRSLLASCVEGGFSGSGPCYGCRCVEYNAVDPAPAWASQVGAIRGFRFECDGQRRVALPTKAREPLAAARPERLQNWSRNLGNFADRLAARSTSAVPPPATLRLGDLGRVALGYAALGIVACLGRELFGAFV